MCQAECTGAQLSCFWGGDWLLPPTAPLSTSLKERDIASREACPLGHHKRQVKSKVIAPTLAASRKRLPYRPCQSRLFSKVLLSRAEKTVFSKEWSQVPQAGENVSGLPPPIPHRGQAGEDGISSLVQGAAPGV